jgi:hypothetical protein
MQATLVGRGDRGVAIVCRGSFLMSCRLARRVSGSYLRNVWVAGSQLGHSKRYRAALSAPVSPFLATW